MNLSKSENCTNQKTKLLTSGGKAYINRDNYVFQRATGAEKDKSDTDIEQNGGVSVRAIDTKPQSQEHSCVAETLPAKASLPGNASTNKESSSEGEMTEYISSV